MWTPLHHLLFTFFHVDLQTKLEAPKPVIFIVLRTLHFPNIFLNFSCFMFLFGCLNWKNVEYSAVGGDWLCCTSIVYICSVCICSLSWFDPCSSTFAALKCLRALYAACLHSLLLSLSWVRATSFIIEKKHANAVINQFTWKYLWLVCRQLLVAEWIRNHKEFRAAACQKLDNHRT